MPTLGEGKRMGCVETLAESVWQDCGTRVEECQAIGERNGKVDRDPPHWAFGAVPGSLDLARK